ncbi:hypothetical protein [Deinococcus pimensis]|nr:hypothetical protein [Deinococcus pimensis]
MFHKFAMGRLLWARNASFDLSRQFYRYRKQGDGGAAGSSPSAATRSG